jgi:hypothetical protein
MSSLFLRWNINNFLCLDWPQTTILSIFTSQNFSILKTTDKKQKVVNMYKALGSVGGGVGRERQEVKEHLDLCCRHWMLIAQYPEP